MSVLHVAHRAGNAVDALAPAAALGADLIELDVHLRRRRLEVRHGKSLGPVPWLWEPWYLVPDRRLLLREVQRALPGGAVLMLDLKGWQPWLGALVREAMAGQPPYVVCSRNWLMLDAFRDVPDVRVVHSVRTPAELARLDQRLTTRSTWGVSVHRELLTPQRVSWLRERAEVVMTWPVNTAEAYDAVVGLGVNGVISDDLAVLLRR